MGTTKFPSKKKWGAQNLPPQNFNKKVKILAQGVDNSTLYAIAEDSKTTR